MAVPKKKTSKSARDMRRAHHAEAYNWVEDKTRVSLCVVTMLT
jgi:ribosomal protein L32